MESSQTLSIQNPRTRTKKLKGGWAAFPFILGTVLSLSVASGWAANLIVYMIDEYHINAITTTQINNVIYGCNYLFPVVGAIIADSFFGSFAVILVFAFTSLMGVIILTLGSTIQSLRPQSCTGAGSICESPSHLQYGVLYLGLALASLGVGGTRFTPATMGADQFDKPKDQAIFFNWFFLALYAGAAICVTGIVYIQDNVNWGLGFGICVITNAIGLVVFLIGKRFYRQTKPKGSPFTSIVRVLVAAARKRKYSGSLGSQDYYHGETTVSNMVSSAPTESLRFFNCAALKTEVDRQSDGSYSRSWRLCTVQEVEDLKTLIKIIPLWSSTILLSTTISMLYSLVILQALTMDRHLGPHFEIPAGSFIAFPMVATALSIFVIDRGLVPTWQILIGRSLTHLQRIGIGHVINILTMVASALIESRRLGVVRAHGLTGVPPPGSIVPMSALWLAVALVIVGIAEGFHFPAQVALYYQEFPRSLRSTSTAMISVIIGIGYYLSTALTGILRRSTEWLSNNINEGRLDNVYWTLAVIGLVNFGYYIACASLFKYKNPGDQEKFSDDNA